MAQQKIYMNGNLIYQPDEGLTYSFETTYTEGSARSTTGKLKAKPLYTIEQLSYKATNVPKEEAQKIINIVGRGGIFLLTYFSPRLCKWTTQRFYVGQGSLTIKTLKENEECFDLSFDMTAAVPLSS